MHLENFSYKKVEGANKVKLQVAIGPAHPGIPWVLLHGFPETHLAWRKVAPELAKSAQVYCFDLRGYGDSDKPQGDEQHNDYSKRTMAQDIVEAMHRLGVDRFAVAGHDRGALVGFRLALDHPEVVAGLLVLDVIPILNTWESLQGVYGVFGYHQYLLAQPPDFPEKLLGAAPEIFLENTLNSWNKTPDALPADIRQAYLDWFKQPASIHAVCEDYRAGAFVDIAHDQADQKAGHKLDLPLKVLWQKAEGFDLPFDPLKIWQSWSKHKVTGQDLACGHFVHEEKPGEVLQAIREMEIG